ncbi:MAG TPA: ornithine cyclodeaminase family protein [Alphaproteobacteria bacterium]|nr:ornithine cyclodeaminase family protein [Alphaproteobacteria bacterium]
MVVERKLLYLARADVEAVALPTSEVVAAVELALREKAFGRAKMPPKHWLAPVRDRFFSAMTSVLPAVSAAACKWQSGSPLNERYGLPFITGLLILNDLETGSPIAVMDSTWLTAQRTAAATAVAARYLARMHPQVLAVLGCGIQGRTNVEMLRLVCLGLTAIQAYDILPEALQRYADEMTTRHGLQVRQCKNPREAIEGADIVVTCGPITADPQRIAEAGWLKPGALVVTLDYDCYWRAEALAAVDALYADDRAQLEHLKQYGYFGAVRQITSELGEVVAGLKPGRSDDRHTIVSINMGIALEDVATARRIYEQAIAQKRGIWLPW